MEKQKNEDITQYLKKFEEYENKKKFNFPKATKTLNKIIKKKI